MKKSLLSFTLILALLLPMLCFPIPADAAVQKISYTEWDKLNQKFTPVDISKVANMAFADDMAGDGKGGWTDQGSINDMAFYNRFGDQVFNGVPFNIINPEDNDGRAVITMKGQSSEFFPTNVEIPIGGQTAAGVYVLHSCGFINSNTEVADYVFMYEDGTESVVTIRPNKDIFNWWGAGSSDTVETAITIQNQQTTAVSIYLFHMENPNPGKKIDKIRIQTGGTGAYLVVVGMTLTDKGPYYMVGEDVGNPDTSDWFPWEIQGTQARNNTVLDMSWMLDAPAGKHGYIKDDGTGHLYFEDGTPARFWGCNIGNEQTGMNDHGRMERLAEKVASYGFNMIRFHHPEGGNGTTTNGLYAESERLWQKSIGSDLDPNIMDGVCKLLYEMKKRGIYAWLDVMTVGLNKANNDYTGKTTGFGGQMQFYDEKQRDMHLRHIENFLGWYNPYTGMTIAEDPMVVFIAFSNESQLISLALDYEARSLLNPKFCEWLRKKYGTEERLVEEWKQEGRNPLEPGESLEANNISVGSYGSRSIYTVRRHEDIIHFLADIQSEWYKIREAKTREMGFKGLCTAVTDWGNTEFAHLYSLMCNDFIDVHAYQKHPSNNNYMRAGTSTPGPGSMLVNESLGMMSVFMGKTIYNKPRTITEWEACIMNPYITEEGPIMAAFSSLHNWHPFYFALGENYGNDLEGNMQIDSEGVGPLDIAVGTGNREYKENKGAVRNFFSMENVPTKLAMLPSSGVAYLRGDIQEAKTGFFNRMSANNYFDTVVMNRNSDVSTGAVGKHGLAYDSFDYDPEYNDNDVLYIDKMSTKLGVPHVSVTGEIETDIPNQRMRINTENYQSSLGFIKNVPMETDDMIVNVDNKYATIQLLSLSKTEPIWNAEKSLLSMASDFRNTGEERTTTGSTVTQTGVGPVLVEPITGTITLKTQDELTIHTIGANGERKGLAYTTKDENGWTVLHLRAADECLNYEIVRTKKAEKRGKNEHIEFKYIDVKPLYNDLAGYEWAEKQITRMGLLDVIGGTSDTTFSPGAPITRAAFIDAIVKAVDLRGAASTNFADISNDNKYKSSLSRIHTAGIIKGDENDNLNPDEPITREEAMDILRKIMDARYEPRKDPAGEFDKYADKNEVDAKYVDSMRIMLAQAYISELFPEKIEPKKLFTRAEAAYALYGVQWY